MSSEKTPGASAYLLGRSPGLRAYLRVLLGNLHEAEDVLQELFLRYLRAGPAAGTTDADRWLFRVARNLALKVIRSSRRRQAREAAYDPERPAEPGPAESAALKEDTGHIQRCLDRLEADTREMIYLKLVEELSYREIAEHTGVPRSTVALRVQEGLARLAKLFHER